MTDEELAVIESASLGFENHGILTIQVMFRGEGGGWSQGINGLAYASRSWSNTEGALMLTNTIKGLLETFGLDDWSRLTGQRCRIRRSDGYIDAVRPLSFDRDTKWFEFADETLKLEYKR